MQFWSEFGVFLKEGVAVDPGSRRRWSLLRFRSTHSGDELTSLADYVSRMRPDQDVIYYVLGEDYASVKRRPHPGLLPRARHRGALPGGPRRRLHDGDAA